MRPAIALFAILSTVCLVACRRSTAPARGPVATPTLTAVATPVSILPPGVLTTLRRYALVQNDMPASYTAGGLLEVPNEQAATDYADLQAAKQEIADTGRQGGLGQQIMGPPTVNGTFGLSIELFKDAAGAQRWASQPPASPPDLQMTRCRRIAALAMRAARCTGQRERKADTCSALVAARSSMDWEFRCRQGRSRSIRCKPSHRASS